MEKILILENGNKSGLKSIIDFYLKEDYYKYELHVTTEEIGRASCRERVSSPV